MSQKQKIRIMAVCFLLLGIMLYLIGETIFALVMVFGGVVTFFIADKATGLSGDDNFMEDDFKFGR